MIPTEINIIGIITACTRFGRESDVLCTRSSAIGINLIITVIIQVWSLERCIHFECITEQFF